MKPSVVYHMYVISSIIYMIGGNDLKTDFKVHKGWEEIVMDNERDDRQAALDEFAASTQVATTTAPLVPIEVTHAPPPDLMDGPKNIRPRDLTTIFNRVKTLAAAAGTDWYYRWPVKNKKTGQTDWIEGPSKELANSVFTIYGNSRVHPWVSAEGLDYWEFTALFVDFETGSVMARPFRQRKTAGRIGGDDGLRNMEIAYAIGASKATRNIIINALGPYTKFAFEEARGAIVDKIGKDIEKWRGRTVERIGRLVDIHRVEAVIGRSSRDWLAADIAMVVAMGTAINDGMATIDETFPPVKADVKPTDDQLDALAKQSPGGSMAPGDTSAAEAPPVAAAADEPRTRAIDKLLEVASSRRLSPQERLEAIDEATPQFDELVDPAFLAGLVGICGRLARDEIKQSTALKEVEALP
jgi:hypothetical protein